MSLYGQIYRAKRSARTQQSYNRIGTLEIEYFSLLIHRFYYSNATAKVAVWVSERVDEFDLDACEPDHHIQDELRQPPKSQFFQILC